MEIISIIGFIILIIVALSLGKIMSHALRFAFYCLLIVLFLVFIYGISFDDVRTGVTAAIMWFF